MNVRAMGKAGLSGWQAKVGERVAQPVAERTRWDQEQVLSAIGWLLLLLSLYQFVGLVRKVIRAGRELE